MASWLTYSTLSTSSEGKGIIVTAGLLRIVTILTIRRYLVQTRAQYEYVYHCCQAFLEGRLSSKHFIDHRPLEKIFDVKLSEWKSSHWLGEVLLSSCLCKCDNVPNMFVCHPNICINTLHIFVCLNCKYLCQNNCKTFAKYLWYCAKMPFSKKPAKFSCFFFHPNTAGTARSTIRNHSTAFLYKYKSKYK